MFHRILFLAAAIALVACGGSETPTQTAAEEPAPPAAAKPPPVAAPPPARVPAPAASPAQIPSTAAETGAMAATPPESAQCLDLVGKGAFAEAVPVCVRAVGLDPDNAAVKQALETARTKVAGASAEAVLGKAPTIPGSASDAAGALGGKLP